MQSKQRRSRYFLPPENERKKFIYHPGIDNPILEHLDFFRIASSEMLAAVLLRNKQSLDRRLMTMWHNGIIAKHCVPKKGMAGGSNKALFYIGAHGASILNKLKGKRIYKAKYNLESDYGLSHRIAVNHFGSIAMAAGDRHPIINSPYHFRDGAFRLRFTVTEKNKKRSTTIIPDWTFAITGHDLKRPHDVKNFFVELQRPTRKTLISNNPQTATKTIYEKYRYYVLARKHRLFEKLEEQGTYPDTKHLKSFIVLTVCDGHSEKQFDNLIETARKAFKDEPILRLFWFARLKNFDIKRPFSLYDSVWRTCKPGDERLFSIVS